MNRRSFLTVAGSSLLAACNADDLFTPTRIYMEPSLSARAATVKILRDKAFAAKVNFYPCTGWDVQGCYFHQGYGLTVSSGQPWTTFANNVVRVPGAFEVVGGGHMNDVVILSSAATNPHFLKPASNINQDSIFDGLIFEYLNTASNGDCFMLPQKKSGVVRHYVLIRPIALPSLSGNNSGVLVAQLGGPAIACSLLRPTALIGSNGGLGGGETYPGYPGLYREISGGIFWDTKVRGYALREMGGGQCVPGLVASLGPNVVWNAKGNGIQWPGVTGALTVADPCFSNPLASLRTCDLANGGIGTNPSGLDGLLTGRITPTMLLAFIRAGFTPQNPACAGMGA
jgi:hypothetical protein